MRAGKKKPKVTRQQRRLSATRKKLLEAARSVFAEKGLDNATIADITERADVGKGTFYYHFNDKNGLIAELIKSVLGELVSAMKNKCAGISNVSEMLDTIIGVHIEFFSNRWEDFVLYFQGRGDLHLEVGYEGIEPRYLDYLQSMETLISTAVHGQISKQSLRRIVCAAAGFVSGYYSFAVITTEDEDVDKTLRSLRGALVGSLTRFVSESVPRMGSVAKIGPG
jgi:AcrR family transcriptional regulator